MRYNYRAGTYFNIQFIKLISANRSSRQSDETQYDPWNLKGFKGLFYSEHIITVDFCQKACFTSSFKRLTLRHQ